MYDRHLLYFALLSPPILPSVRVARSASGGPACSPHLCSASNRRTTTTCPRGPSPCSSLSTGVLYLRSRSCTASECSSSLNLLAFNRHGRGNRFPFAHWNRPTRCRGPAAPSAASPAEESYRTTTGSNLLLFSSSRAPSRRLIADSITCPAK